MASNTVVKTDRYSEVEHDDPLAELSRIMGLERQPGSDTSHVADFGIDLEKELLGELSANDDVASGASVEPSDFDLDFDAAFADLEVGSDPVEPVAEDAATQDFAFDDAVLSELMADELRGPLDDAAAQVAPVSDAADPGFGDPGFGDPDFSDPDFSDPSAGDEHDVFAATDFDRVFDELTAQPQGATAAAPATPALSLEDELEAMLAGSEPVAGTQPAFAQPAFAETAAVEPVLSHASTPEPAFEPLPRPSFTPVPDDMAAAQVADSAAEFAVDAFDTDAADFQLDEDFAVEAAAPEAVADPAAAYEASVEDADLSGAIDDLDISLPDEFAADLEPRPADEPAVAEPVFDEPVAEPSVPVESELEAAIAIFEDDAVWDAAAGPAAAQPVAEPVYERGPDTVPVAPAHADFAAAPSSHIEPSHVEPSHAEPIQAGTARREPRFAPISTEPAPEILDDDPFAALAALASAPPLVKALSRSNPVAVNPTAERPSARSSSFAPVRAPVQSVPAPASAPLRPHQPVARAEAPTLAPMPAASYRSAAPASAFGAATAAAAPMAAASAGPAARVEERVAAAADDLDFSDFDDILSAEELAPEIETVEIAEQAIAVADDLDIPELAVEKDVVAAPAFDDFDSDFAAAFNDLSSAPRAEPAVSHAEQETAYESAAQSGETSMLDEDFAAFQRQIEDEVGAFDDDDAYAALPYEDEVAAQAEAPARRLPLYGAIVAGLALLAGAGAYAYSYFGNGGDATPAVVRADDDPVKVKPETPGGIVVPNQESKVYEQVAGTNSSSLPEQRKLISEAEEPILPEARPANETAGLPGVETAPIKSEERLTADAASEAAPQEAAGIAPRRVRTMVVRPDGTLVEREVEPASAQPAAAATQSVASVEPVVVPTAQEPAAQPAQSQAAQSQAAPAEAQPVVPAPKPVRTTAVTPEPEAKPEPKPVVETAAATPAPAGDLWTVQIASQPSRESAQASYEALASRYSSVIGGKGVNIVQAQVSGRTMWRVRIPAASRNDANILCAKLKTAGGSCFVSK